MSAQPRRSCGRTNPVDPRADAKSCRIPETALGPRERMAVTGQLGRYPSPLTNGFTTRPNVDPRKVTGTIQDHGSMRLQERRLRETRGAPPRNHHAVGTRARAADPMA
jgi:hypothetical protein